jgi:hypothetical protein
MPVNDTFQVRPVRDLSAHHTYFIGILHGGGSSASHRLSAASLGYSAATDSVHVCVCVLMRAFRS